MRQESQSNTRWCVVHLFLLFVFFLGFLCRLSSWRLLLFGLLFGRRLFRCASWGLLRCWCRSEQRGVALLSLLEGLLELTGI